MEVIKISENSIQVSKEKASEPEITAYDYDFLIAQKAQIIKDANNYLAQRQKELDEVLELLAQCDALGVKAKEMPSPITK